MINLKTTADQRAVDADRVGIVPHRGKDGLDRSRRRASIRLAGLILESRDIAFSQRQLSAADFRSERWR
jgi:hypothetical protein